MSSAGDRILDVALELAETSSWERLTLREVAEALAITLADVQACYPDKDDVVEAWFDRADRAMLSGPPIDTALPGAAPVTRLHSVIMRWFDAMAGHRRVTGQMLLYKLEPGHFHLQALGIMRISRTVQWFREAAGVSTTHFKRIAGEVALTSAFLQTFAYWLNDGSADSANTRRFLDLQLRVLTPLLS